MYLNALLSISVFGLWLLCIFRSVVRRRRSRTGEGSSVRVCSGSQSQTSVSNLGLEARPLCIDRSLYAFDQKRGATAAFSYSGSRILSFDLSLRLLYMFDRLIAGGFAAAVSYGQVFKPAALKRGL